MKGIYQCEFPNCDRRFDNLPDDHDSALGFYCDEHEEYMEEHCSEQRDRDRQISLEQVEWLLDSGVA